MLNNLSKISIFALLTLVATSAWAQETRPLVDINLFQPTAGATNFFTTQSGRLNGHLGFSGGLMLNYARNPLSVRLFDVDEQQDVGAVIGHRLDTSIHLALGLFEYFELGFAMPFIFQTGTQVAELEAANIILGGNSLEGFGVGDPRITPKAGYSYKDGLVAVAAFADIVIPIGQSKEWAGEGRPVYSPGFAVSTKIGPFRGALNGGYRFRQTTAVQPIEDVTIIAFRDEVYAKLALAFDAKMGKGQPIEIVGEIYGHTPADNFFNTADFSGENDGAFLSQREDSRQSLEGVLGIRAQVANSVIISAGVGGGLKPGGYGQAVPRIFAGLTYFSKKALAADTDGDGVVDSADQCPEKLEDKDGFEDGDGCPEADNDQDLVLDEDDQCINEPEDRDGLSDDDGCPETDDDQDGTPDETDQCPSKAEDQDGFEDEDGCPDLDNDGDQVVDANDQCPMEAEDVDGFQDSDGCPEPDNDNDGLADLGDLCPNFAEDKDGVADDDGCPEENDGDGIPDELDKCPNKAENYNGIEDEDGCPEKTKVKSLVKVTADKIEIREKVFFATGSDKIATKSFTLLDQVASVLKGYKNIRKLRIEGHTDNKGKRKSNIRLSQRRATSVKKYLVEKGVAADRLDAVGLGPAKPVASNRSRRGREQNRRVDFFIVEQTPVGVDVSASEEPAPEPAAVETPSKEEAPKSNDTGEVEFEF